MRGNVAKKIVSLACVKTQDFHRHRVTSDTMLKQIFTYAMSQADEIFNAMSAIAQEPGIKRLLDVLYSQLGDSVVSLTCSSLNIDDGASLGLALEKASTNNNVALISLNQPHSQSLLAKLEPQVHQGDCAVFIVEDLIIAGRPTTLRAFLKANLPTIMDRYERNLERLGVIFEMELNHYGKRSELTIEYAVDQLKALVAAKKLEVTEQVASALDRVGVMLDAYMTVRQSELGTVDEAAQKFSQAQMDKMARDNDDMVQAITQEQDRSLRQLQAEFQLKKKKQEGREAKEIEKKRQEDLLKQAQQEAAARQKKKHCVIS